MLSVFCRCQHILKLSSFLVFFSTTVHKVHLPLNEKNCRRLLSPRSPCIIKNGRKWSYSMREGLIENKVLIIAVYSSSSSRFCPSPSLSFIYHYLPLLVIVGIFIIRSIKLRLLFWRGFSDVLIRSLCKIIFLHWIDLIHLSSY